MRRFMLLLAVILLVLVSGCRSLDDDTIEHFISVDDNTSLDALVEEMKPYSMEDFKEFVVGESTINDIREHIETYRLYYTSYGGILEVPTEEGNWIQVTLIGDNYTISNISICDYPWHRMPGRTGDGSQSCG